MEKIDHLLIVDDDPEIRDLLAQYLKKNGFHVSTAANGKQLRQLLAASTKQGAAHSADMQINSSASIDLIVLDLMMPGEDGLSLCRDLRANGFCTTPILMLTAMNEEADRILGLEMGADDYLTKPFASRELLARIRAILRRARMFPPNLQTTSPVHLSGNDNAHFLSFGQWRLDTTARHLLDNSGMIVSLSGAEYRLLRVFLDHPRRVLNRDQLLSLTQGREADVFDRSIDILVSRLRKRLADDGAETSYIKTIRNEGYVFAAAVEAQAGKA